MNSQKVDQTLKGAVAGFVAWVLYKFNVDPALIAATVPLLVGVLAVVSMRVGDKRLASFITTVEDVVVDAVEGSQ